MSLMKQVLLDAGVQVHIATTDDDGPGRRMAPSFAQVTALPSQHIFRKRTEFYKIAPEMGAWLGQHVGKYDLVHIHALFSYSSIAAARAARKAGVPYIVRPLGTLTRYGIEQRRPWLKRISLRWLEGPLLRHAAAVHFTAEAERDEAAVLGIPMRGIVLPLAVDAAAEPDFEALFHRFPALRGANYLLFLSRLDPKKNVEALLDAMLVLMPNHPELLLVVAGDGDPSYVAQLKQRANSLGISSRLVWTGFLDGGLKAAALKGASVFVLPSFSENFGIAAAEALAAGLPCVLGQGVALAAQVEAAGAGSAVAPTSAAIAAAVSAYLIDADKRGQASRAASLFAKQELSLAAMGHGLVALYSDVIERHQKATLVSE